MSKLDDPIQREIDTVYRSYGINILNVVWFICCVYFFFELNYKQQIKEDSNIKRIC